MLLTLIALLLSADPPKERPGDLVWATPESLQKGGDRTFMALGTREGHRYIFRARGRCDRDPIVTLSTVAPLQGGPARGLPIAVIRPQPEPIFGIDFRVIFGSLPHRFLNMGEGKPEQTELTFIADRDDLPIRLSDHWELPKSVKCTVDNFEIVVAPPEP